MIKRICDKCGKDIPDDRNFIRVDFHRYTTEGMYAIPSLELDICEDCYDKIRLIEVN